VGRLIRAGIVVLAVFIAACATTPTTPRQGVAACYSSVAASFNSAADVKARGALPKDVEDKVLKAGDEALRACDAARIALAGGDLSTTNGKLKAAESALLILESQLKGR
jgi:hypothetical protein